MKTLWDNPRDLFINGLFDVMPDEAKKAFESGISYFLENQYTSAVSSILTSLNLVICRFTESLSQIHNKLDIDDAMSILILAPSVSLKLLSRLEFIQQTYHQSVTTPKRNFSEHEVEYLIVTCIDVCERMLSDDRYRETMLN